MVICAEMYVAKLESEGLKYTVRDLPNNGTCVSVGFGMTVTNTIFEGDDNGTHVGFRTQFERCSAEKIPDMLVICNAMNSRYRWLKFYVDKDNDIMIADDAILNPENAGEECFEIMLRTAQIIDEVKPLFMKALYA